MLLICPAVAVCKAHLRVRTEISRAIPSVILSMHGDDIHAFPTGKGSTLDLPLPMLVSGNDGPRHPRAHVAAVEPKAVEWTDRQVRTEKRREVQVDHP